MDLKRTLITTEKEFDDMILKIKNAPFIAIDTENNGLNPKFCKTLGFSLAVNETEGYYIPVAHVDIKTDLGKRFKEVLQNKKLIIMHNAVYDSNIFHYHYDSIEDYVWFDTMIAQHLIDEVKGKGLKYLSERYFGYTQTKFNEMANGVSYDKITANQIWKYACDDAIMTFKLFMLLKEKLKEEELDKLMMRIEMPFQKTLAYVRRQGITFDLEGCTKLEKELEVESKESIKEIISSTNKLVTSINLITGAKVLLTNLDSSKDLIKLLYDKLNLPVKAKTVNGAPAVDSKALKKLKHPIIKPLLKYKEIKKLLSTYTSSLAKKVESDGRIYTSLLDHGTVTGRISSSSPNFQNLPSNDHYKVRGLFIASKGWKMLVIDFSQEEFRLAGIITGSKVIEDVYKNNLDLHLKTANEVWSLNIPEECLVDTHPKYEEYKTKFYKQRFNAKGIGFGILYGRTAYGLQSQLGGSVEECEKMVEDYFKKFPKIKKAIDKSIEEIKNVGFVRNLFNRKRRFDKKKLDKHAFNQCFNFKIQGSCADILRIVMNKCYDYIKLNMDEVRMLTTVHDEIMFEIKENENFDNHEKQLKYIMENAVKFNIPLTVSGGTGYNYSEAK